MEKCVEEDMEVVIAIDGTGPVSDEEYERHFKDSFCNQISKMSSNAKYYRGVPGEPDEVIKSLMVMVDSQVEQISRRASSSIAASAKRHSKEWGEIFKQIPIYLVGYSRGGLSCVELAGMLQKQGMDVEAMYLFDAVNMTDQTGRGDVIPKNVKKCYHAMRSPVFFTEYLRKYEKLKRENSVLNYKTGFYTYMGDKEELDKASQRLDRTRSNIRKPWWNWGNCAVKHEGEAGQLVTRKFKGSHGALGGVPWSPDVFPEDKKCKADVQAWMWKQLWMWKRPSGMPGEAARRILQTA